MITIRRVAGAMLAGSLALVPVAVVVEVATAAPASAEDYLTIIGMGILKDGRVYVVYSDGTYEIWG